MGLTFVSADNGGSYDPANRTVTWNVPALSRDETIELVVTATVDGHQADAEIVNSATLVNPVGYSVPVIEDPCATSPDDSCARTTVPVTLSVLAQSGSDFPVAIAVLAVLAMVAGLVLRHGRKAARHRA